MANGTIAFDTLQTSGQITGTAKSVDTDYVVNGSVKLWAKVNQDTPALTNSFNVTSLTDTATGQYILVSTNNFGDANYVVTAMAQAESSNNNKTEYQLGGTSTTANVAINNVENGSDRDQALSSNMVIGDLA